MAKIVHAKTKSEREVPNGEKIKPMAEELGVLFGCEDGICGTCMVDVVRGEENLSELTQQEKDLERDKTHRLACQCKIKKGTVVLDF
jgi:ferredoxin